MNRKSERMVRTVTDGKIEWTLPNGETIAIDVDALNEEIQRAALIHGITQKVADAAAMESKQPDGSFRKPTWKQKYDRMLEVAVRLRAGEWNAASGGPIGTLFARALMEYRPAKFSDAAAATKWLDDAAKARNVKRVDVERSMLAEGGGHPKLAEIFARLQSERANPDLGAELFDDLDKAEDSTE